MLVRTPLYLSSRAWRKGRLPSRKVPPSLLPHLHPVLGKDVARAIPAPRPTPQPSPRWAACAVRPTPCASAGTPSLPTSTWKDGTWCERCPEAPPSLKRRIQRNLPALCSAGIRPPTQQSCSPKILQQWWTLGGKRARTVTWKSRLCGYFHGNSSISKATLHLRGEREMYNQYLFLKGPSIL